MSDITILHNPHCGTSRNTLAIIRDAGIEPLVVEYKTPPSSSDSARDEAVPALRSSAGSAACGQAGAFEKEGGEMVIDTGVRRA